MLALVPAAVGALDGHVVLQEGRAEDHELGPPLVEGAHLDGALEGRVPLVDVLRVEDLDDKVNNERCHEIELADSVTNVRRAQHPEKL